MAVKDPVLAIRRFCLECQGGSSRAVRTCTDTRCPLWDWRCAAQEATDEKVSHLALRAIRRQCMGCAGERAEVRRCAGREECALWRYRFGVFPQTYKNVRRRFFAPRALNLFS